MRTSARWFSEAREISSPLREYVPEVATSRQPMMFISVVLPEPEGPMMAR